ncbi:unnamed protein product [Gongylonema pulchrum]|uniref:2OG-FeII_Oxy_4 domain-containing protein n=1 Tax=Gongylonema pulchrum TaxID=637853 RepID=A0A183DFZ7_9BILA|nr:unnamed protein product [Gongylonema pulchrum]
MGELESQQVFSVFLLCKGYYNTGQLMPFHPDAFPRH